MPDLCPIKDMIVFVPFVRHSVPHIPLRRTKIFFRLFKKNNYLCDVIKQVGYLLTVAHLKLKNTSETKRAAYSP